MAAASSPEHPARLLISSMRKPISYVPTVKRHLQEHGEVHLSALGIACSSMVTVAEILKARKLAVEKRVGTMLEQLEDEGRPRQKPKMEVLLVKSPQFDALIAAEKEETEREAAAKAAAAAAAAVKADSDKAAKAAGGSEEQAKGEEGMEVAEEAKEAKEEAAKEEAAEPATA